jgi:hypothetical protein
MKLELEQKLIKKYPKILADINKSPQETLICFGCECGDGWYKLLDSLFKALQRTVDEDKEPQPVVFQVKEKWGSLSVYLMSGTKTQYALIDMASDLSTKICENCGDMRNVKLRQGGWLHNFCDSCEENRNKK